MSHDKIRFGSKVKDVYIAIIMNTALLFYQIKKLFCRMKGKQVGKDGVVRGLNLYLP